MDLTSKKLNELNLIGSMDAWPSPKPILKPKSDWPPTIPAFV